MNNTVVFFDNGTSTTQDTGNWTPLLNDTSGNTTSLKGNIQIENMQFRGLLDFGQTDLGLPQSS